MQDPIVIAEYNPEWPQMYEKEAAVLRHALGPLAVQVQHIGSTAVPGLAAKPIIDILVGVEKLGPAGDYLDRLAPLGYANVSHDQDSSRLFFRAGSPPSYHLHIVSVDSPTYLRHIMFRDFLRASSHAAKEYENLKRTMAEKFADDRSAYVDAKTAFVALP